MSVRGLMPVAWEGMGGKNPFMYVQPCTPSVCAACGMTQGRHPWGCPVAVRLTAQLLATCDPGRMAWRQRAVWIAANVFGRDPWCPEAEHWRAASRVEVDFPGPVGVYDRIPTPDLHRDDVIGGVREADPAAGATRPFCEALTDGPLRVALTRAFGADWDIVRDPLILLDSDPEEEARTAHEV